LAQGSRRTGWNIAQRHIFEKNSCAPTRAAVALRSSMVGPLLIQYGNDEQKKRFLPKILAGEEVWCQGSSEPNAGSDLASLQLRAEKDGDDYILNGQKTWTTNAQYAHWIFLLARPEAGGKKQEGITFILADVRNTPGITVKPFLTPAAPTPSPRPGSRTRVPQANRVGPENGGWTMAKALLGHERTLIGGIAESRRWLRLCKRIAAATTVGSASLLEDVEFRRRIARLEMRLRSLEMVQLRTLAAAQLGRAPGPESSILKLVGTDVEQEITELCMDGMGHDALGWLDSPPEALPEVERGVASLFNYLRAASIYGGSNEIQRNIIAKQILRLPTA
jgi:alkylation response protein AidB-like acyl-CoA dehydrogenase